MQPYARIDWDNLRKDYEENYISVTRLARKYGCSTATIYHHIRSEGWHSPTPMEKASTQVDPSDSDDHGDVESQPGAENTTETPADPFFKDGSDVHDNIRDQKKMLARLMRELDRSTSKLGQFEQWIKEGLAGNIDSRRRVIYQAMTLKNRMSMLLDASRVLKTIVDAEVALGTEGGAKGKKERLAEAAKELEDERFATRKVPIAA